MADLLLDWVKAEPSFTYIGLGMLGPFILKLIHSGIKKIYYQKRHLLLK